MFGPRGRLRDLLSLASICLLVSCCSQQADAAAARSFCAAPYLIVRRAFIRNSI